MSDVSQLQKVLDRIDADFDNSLERLFALLRIKSISADPAFAADCRAAADHLCKDIATLGFASEVRPTDGHPAILAKSNSGRAGKRPHVLFYGHYDVQPVDPLNLWHRPPFDPLVTNHADGRKIIVARGAEDDKGQLMTFVGQHYHVTRHQLHLIPVQRPHPPVLIGGNGLRLLTLAAQEADIVGLTGITFRPGDQGPELSGWTVAGVEERLQRIRDMAGARYERLELNALVQRVEVTDHRYIAAEELAHRWPQLSPADILESPYVLLGTVEQIVEDLQRRRERWGFSSYMLFERDMETFAPVVARLAGQ